MFFIFAVLTLLVAVSAEPINLRDAYLRSPGSRIIGGENTTIEKHPYQVSLQISSPDDPEFFRHGCGGVIISARYVVTAAHCLYFQPIPRHVRAGSSFVSQKGSMHEIDWFKMHDKFAHSLNKSFDIGLIRVKEPFHFDESRQPIELADKEASPGTMATVTGWGNMNWENPKVPNQLQVVSLPIIEKKKCHEALESMGGLPENQICGGYLGQGGKSPCHGDSGGPLVIGGKLVGLVSWGRVCAGPNDPAVFTDVVAFRDWISEHTVL